MPVLTGYTPDGAMTVSLTGTLDATCVADLDQALANARILCRPIILDLSRVRLMDRPTLQYMMDVIRGEIHAVVGCPEHVARWIRRESDAREPSRAFDLR